MPYCFPIINFCHPGVHYETPCIMTTYANFKLFVPCILSTYGIKTNWCHYFNFIYILPDLYMFQAHRPIFRRVRTAAHTTIGSVSVLLWPCALCVQSTRSTQSTRPEQYRHWTNGCVNRCVNSPEDGPVGPKHVEIQQYTNKIVTSFGFYSIRHTQLQRICSSSNKATVIIEVATPTQWLRYLFIYLFI